MECMKCSISSSQPYGCSQQSAGQLHTSHCISAAFNGLAYTMRCEQGHRAHRRPIVSSTLPILSSSALSSQTLPASSPALINGGVAVSSNPTWRLACSAYSGHPVRPLLQASRQVHDNLFVSNIDQRLPGITQTRMSRKAIKEMGKEILQTIDKRLVSGQGFCGSRG